MDLWHEISLYFSDAGANRRLVLLGLTLLGISSGVLGTFAFLRRQSLLGDAMAHAALPGVCLVFLLTQQKDPLLFLLGASATGLAGALTVTLITRYSRIKNDTAIGLVLSVFFGFGIVLLTLIQQGSYGNQSGLDTFLFGKAASLLNQDLYIIAIMGFVLLLLVFLFYKEFKILSFDPAFTASLGFPVKFLDMFLTGLVVMSVMIGLQAVGVVLMVAIIIIPAAAARQWTNRLGAMIVTSALLGAISGIVGAVLSTFYPKTPTGPVMVLAASTTLVISIFCAPRRGLVPRWARRRKNRLRIQRENVLKTAYKLCEDCGDFTKTVTASAISKQIAMQIRITRNHLRYIAAQNWIRDGGQGWRLTDEGLRRARQLIRKHRLWELYLTKQMDIASDHVHRVAEEIEHILPPAIVQQLEKVLDSPDTDPHGRPIPPGNGMA